MANFQINNTTRKAFINALHDEKKEKMTVAEKQYMVKELLKIYSYGKLKEITGIAKSTMHHWMCGRSNKDLLGKYSDVDSLLAEMIDIIGKISKHPVSTKGTIDLIRKLKDRLNILEMRIERRLK